MSSAKTTIRKTISMPADMSEFVEEQVSSGQYGNDSEYFRDLVRRDQQRKATIARFQKLIDEGIASGISERTIEEIWEDAKRKHAARTKK